MAPEVARSGTRQPAERSRCARCGAPFRCGIDDMGGCWCAKLPPLPREAYADAAGCLCEACLTRALREAREEHRGNRGRATP
jgi:ribosomal protein L34E